MIIKPQSGWLSKLAIWACMDLQHLRPSVLRGELDDFFIYGLACKKRFLCSFIKASWVMCGNVVADFVAASTRAVVVYQKNPEGDA